MIFALMFLLAIIVGLVSRNSKVVSVLSALASISLVVEATGGIVFHTVISGITVAFATDELSGFFAILVGVAGFAVSVYSLSYMGRRHLVTAAYPLFVLSMALIVLARDFLTLLIFWELMTAASYVLIMYNHERRETLRASVVYLVAMHALNTAPLIMGLGYVYSHAGTLDYSALSGTVVPSWVIWALTVGFLAKAGIFPLHFWLPEAHPVAPSNVSALLSGVMLKMAVYGMLRTLETFGRAGSIAVPLVVLSIVTIALGSLLALNQKDIKRMMAYSSIDNMGYIFLAIGAYLLLSGELKEVAITAVLLHSFNHMLFKNLLFMLSGNILHATGRKDTGIRGLSREMPITFGLSIVGILAVSGVPPLNGFASKWLIYRATFLSKNPLLVAGGAVALLGSALTLAAYLKLYRVFTCEPNVEAEEAPLPMLLGEGILAFLCVVGGVVPGILLRPVGLPYPATLDLPLFTLIIAVLIASLFVALPPRARESGVWTNGEPVEEFEIKPEHMYTGVSGAVQRISAAGDRIQSLALSGSRFYRSTGGGYIDEALFMPLIRLSCGFGTCFKELSKELNGMLATTFLVLVAMVIAFLAFVGVIG
ncbi:proton-conducting transporter membrane subunit [Thermococcus sp. JdF3]|uniref:proton-conducting transporter transmembrane domain-containing protein n=1 Tax=Thermococcus sp. JdF3 TaxID=1638258 RepID=UPI00143AD3D7|nr:proton-conducting transporter membrane subunit [Thermococcus sp. JdF3]NJE01080.1 formate hydrogenlyase [Thermococcus sp. JdF3]